MFFRGFVFSVLVLVSMHTPAQANDATAAKLKQALAEQITHTQAGQPYTLETSGNITVVPKDDYYTATLPGVQVSYAENMVFDVGTVIINAIPAGEDEWKMSMALPSPILVKDKLGKPVADIKIGQQKTGAVWLPKLNIFPKFEVDYKDIQVETLVDKKFNLSIGHLRTVTNLEQDGDNKWSGPYTLRLSNIVSTHQGENDSTLKIALDSMNARTAYTGFDMSSFEAFNKYMEKVNTTEQSEQDKKEIARQLFSYARNMAKDMESDVTLSGLRISGQTKDGMPIDGSVDSLKFVFNMMDLNSDAAHVTWIQEMTGLKIGSDTAKDYTAYIPQDIRFDVRLEQFPYDTFMKNLVEYNTVTEGTPAKPLSTNMLTDMLVQAGTRLVIKDNYFKAPELTTTMEGLFMADATSPLKASGSLTTKITGLDAAIEKMSKTVEQKKQNPETLQEAATIQKAMQPLVMLQMMGQANTNPDGSTTGERSYRLELRPDGQLLLNGAPLSGLMPQIQMPQQAPAQAPAPAQETP